MDICVLVTLVRAFSSSWSSDSSSPTRPASCKYCFVCRHTADLEDCVAPQSALLSDSMKQVLFIIVSAVSALGAIYANSERGVHLPIQRGRRLHRKRDGDIADTGLGDVLDV